MTINPFIVCHESIIKGNVTLGEGCIIHPASLIDGGKSGIRIGRNNVVEELVKIVNNNDFELQIGDNNWFHVACEVIDSKSIGNNNCFEVNSKITKDCTIGDHCNVSARTVLPPGFNLQSNKSASLIHNSLFTTDITKPLNQYLNDQVNFLISILRGSSMEKKE